jgi:hypothetical protein
MKKSIILAGLILSIGTAALSQVGNSSQVSIEEEARRLAAADVSRNGVPRKVSDVYNLIKVEAIGNKFVKTYEFASPIAQVSESDKRALRQEAEQNFQANGCSSALRPFLRRGLIIVQKINYLNAGNIISTEFGESNCR